MALHEKDMKKQNLKIGKEVPLRSRFRIKLY